MPEKEKDQKILGRLGFFAGRFDSTSPLSEGRRMRRYLTGTRAFKIYQDDLCMPLVIHHQTPVHFLVISKNRDGLTQWTNYWDI
jgi:hypothetical protein